MGLRAINNPKSSFEDPYASTGLDAVNAAPQPVVATGGDIYKDSGYVIHVFKSPGNFVFSSGVIDDGEILVIAGGGGGAYDDGGGGGAGGVAWTPDGLDIAQGTYAVVVGDGGEGGNDGTDGGDSTWNAPAPTTDGRITAKGGGAGTRTSGSMPAAAGGSGGGYGYSQTNGGGPATQPTTSNPPWIEQFGEPGSIRGEWGGGGGGAGGGSPNRAGIGGNAKPFASFPGPLFAAPNSPTGSAMPTDWQTAVSPTGLFAGGGGGGGRNGPESHVGGGTQVNPANGPKGGSGNGQGSPNSPVTLSAGLDNTGSGGGGQGAGQGTPGADGGKGIVFVRYKEV